MLAALFSDDTLIVALIGNSVAAAFHFASHLIDIHRGGHTTDPIATGGLLAALVIATLLAMRTKPLRQVKSAVRREADGSSD